ncbi:hypothetical protein HDU76_009303 [Blyttiomyces sp. JEL0837]|nr:hypothetical protein HDU76_009303 [Blyttiomyces sp. JEL0837]
MAHIEHPAGHEADVTGVHGRIRLQKAGNNKDGSWMDKERQQIQAYEYLCHIGEAKEWIEACIKEQIGAVTDLDEELRNGINLAKLARKFSPNSVKKIFEDRTKLQFRHSDNINCLFAAMKEVGLPSVFFFELTDLYEKKNIPKVIYCIHALSHLLAKKGLAPSINNLIGKLEFTDEQLDKTQQSLEESGVAMPVFSNIETALAAEMKEPTPEEKRQAYLLENESKIIKAQATARGYLARKLLKKLQMEEEDRQKKIIRIQAMARMRSARQAHLRRLSLFRKNEQNVVRLQATWKMHKARQGYVERLNNFKSNEQLFTKIQARIKGGKIRQAYLARLNYYKSNQEAVVKIQALWRAKHAKKAYLSLSSLENPPVKTIQEFIHLLDESERDFEDELDLEDLRQLVVKKIRENIATEMELNDLDLKIALLVKNRISLEEVVHSTRKMKMIQLSQESLKGDADNKDHNPFSHKTMDKEARARLEAYQQLFYLLQTQPSYLAKLMFTLNKKSGGSIIKFLEQVVLTLYGYAQNTREEYLLLNLIKTAIKVEVDEINKIDEFWRANPLFIKLVLQYTRGAKERQFLRELLQPLVRLILSDSSLDLETDPVFIYKNLIREEESKSGEQSSRSHDVTHQSALADPEVQRVQKEHVAKLKEITDQFLNAIIGSLKKMPYGIKYIAMEMKNIMREKFPGNDAEVIKIVGNLIYYRYMNPVIVAPEGFDVIESAISPTQRKNLAEVAKTLHQISVNKMVPGEQDELSQYISSAAKKFSAFFNEASNVVSAEEYFNMDEFVDMSRQQKPSIFITPNEIFQIHDALISNIDDLTTDKSDPLRQILQDLGTPPALSEKVQPEVHLKLVNRFAKIEDEAEVSLRHLMSDTKRLVIMIIRIQSGRNLLDILEAPITEKEEQLFNDYVAADSNRYNMSREKKAGQTWRGSAEGINNAASPTSAAAIGGPAMASTGSLFFGSGSYFCLKSDEKTPITFSVLKRRTLENMAKLEAAGQISKGNNYQDMLNAIAKDMLNRHRRKNQRKREYESLRKTLANLEEKSNYLEEQKKSYHDYINACMAQLNKKTGKVKRAPLPFTRQYFHLKELQKTGTMPQYGSFKYTAAELMKKGVIMSIDENVPKQYGHITLTLSSDEAGVFNIEASILGVKVPEKLELRLEDLLQDQYNGVQVMTLFDIAKVNLNLLTYLLNKKFYA